MDELERDQCRRLGWFRRAVGISQDMAAAAGGVSAGRWRAMEQGAAPVSVLAVARMIARHPNLGPAVSTQYVMDGRDDDLPPALARNLRTLRIMAGIPEPIHGGMVH